MYFRKICEQGNYINRGDEDKVLLSKEVAFEQTWMQDRQHNTTLVASLFHTSLLSNADSSFLLQGIPLHPKAFSSSLLTPWRGHSLFLALFSQGLLLLIPVCTKFFISSALAECLFTWILIKSNSQLQLKMQIKSILLNSAFQALKTMHPRRL